MNEHPNQGIMTVLISLLKDGAGISVSESDGNTSFFELGLDSLFLTQFSISVGHRFGTTLTFRQLSSELDNLNKLAAFLGLKSAGLRPTTPISSTSPAEADPGWLNKLLGQSATAERQPTMQEITDPMLQLLLGQLAVMHKQLQAVMQATQPLIPETGSAPAIAAGSSPAIETASQGSAQGTDAAAADARPRTVLDAARPPVPGARLGRDASGKPAWFVPADNQSGKYVRFV